MTIKEVCAEIFRNEHIKSKIIVLLYRLPNIFYYSNAIVRLIGVPLYLINRLVLDFLMGVELNYKVRIGPGLKVYHGVGLVVNTEAVIGMRCTLRSGVVIGNKIDDTGIETGSPVIGDDVEFGANSVVVGDISVGSHAKVGALALVTKNVPSFSKVVGYNKIFSDYE